MTEQLRLLADRFAELEAKAADPAVLADREAYATLMKEYRRLEPTVTKYQRLLAVCKEAEEAKALLCSPDPELAALAGEECRALGKERAELETALRQALLPKDPNDERNVIVEIRAGAGGEEAALFAADLYRMYTMYLERAGFSVSLLSSNETELGGYRELAFLVEGDGAYSRLKFESGVHRVQRVPITESQGRIQTSTVTVAVLPEADEIEVQIAPGDVVMESCKSSGAGGQHINKTESAVRLTHKPTGIVVECQEERSQFKNRDKAMKMLRAILLDRSKVAQHKEIADQRKSQVGTGDRSERIRTYNYPQGRLTDHRIGLSLYNLESILNGNIGELIDALIAADTAAGMKDRSTD